MVFDSPRKFNGGAVVPGRPMRDRQYRHQCFAVLLTLNGKRYDAWPIFASFFSPASRFVIP